MSTLEQRKRLRAYIKKIDKLFEVWQSKESREHKPFLPPLPEDLVGLTCGAKTRAGTPCKQKGIFINGRCKLHGGMSTGPKTKAGKKRSSENGLCPKRRANSMSSS